GAAVIYCSQPVEEQAGMVAAVKSYKAGFVEPVTVGPDMTIGEVVELSVRTGYNTFPVVDPERTLLGLISRNDYEAGRHRDQRVRERMIPRDRLEVGVDITDLKKANERLLDSHHSALPIVDGRDRLRSLVFKKDVRDHLDYPLQVVDARKRLLALAAINTHDYKERVPALADAGADGVAIDSSDGYSTFQQDTLLYLQQRFPELPVLAGNVITAAGFDYLADQGAWAVKVGMGGGSICITQEQKGTGRGLATALMDVCAARDRYRERTGRYVPVVADGGIFTAKDMVMALAIGADTIMMGRYFARMDESPTEKVTIRGRVMKPYWGEGSARAREWREARYSQLKFVEGVEGFVEYAGRLRDNLDGTLAKIRASMSSCGCATLEELHRDAEIEAVSALSIREGDVHDIFMPGNDPSFGSRTWGE
ncbi:MAG: IMP dehydrogenase, partial [Deltaproteobacteria bacterium]|nr:IMP dehydrogenase [Deltaproteobacteria bacterium]